MNMNKTLAKAIWDCMVYYFKNEDTLISKFPSSKDYILFHFSISSNDYDKFYNLYMDWMFEDMNNPGNVGSVYDYIVEHW